MTIDDSKWKNYAGSLYTEGEKARIWSEALRTCSNFNSTDRCDRANERRDCMLAGFERQGVSFRDFAMT